MGFYPQTGAGSTNTPTTVANQPTNLNWLSNLELNNFGALYPDVAPELVKRYGYQSFINLMKNQFGAGTRLSGSTIIRHFEEDFIHGRIAMDETTGITPANGAEVTYNFKPSDVLSVASGAPYVGGAPTDVAVPFPYAIVQFGNGIEAIVTSVNVSAETFTVLPVSADDALGNSSDGEFAIIKGTAVKEGSSALQGRNSRLIYYENYMQEHRSDAEITGRASGELVWFKMPRKHNGGVAAVEDVWTSKAIGDTYLRHMNELEMMLLDGKPITNPLINQQAGFETVSKTEGMIETIQNSGNISTYTEGSMVLADVDALVQSFLRFKAPKQHAVPCGYGFQKDFNKLFREGDGVDLWKANGAGRIVFKQFDGGSQEINIDINGAEYLGFKFATMPLDLFSDQQTLGSVAKYNGMGVFMPLGNTATYVDENPDSKETVPAINIVGKKGANGQSREFREWITGGLAGTDDTDLLKYHAHSECALEVNAVNRFGLILTA